MSTIRTATLGPSTLVTSQAPHRPTGEDNFDAPADLAANGTGHNSPARRRRCVSVLALIALTLGVLLTGVAPAGAVAANNGVINGYGSGMVPTLGCSGTTMDPVVRILAGKGTSAIAFRFWLRPSNSSTWSTTPWRSYNTQPGTLYQIPGPFGLYNEDIPLRGSGAYVVYAEFQFNSGGAWRGQEFVQIGGILSTFGVTNNTGWYCWSQQW